MYVYARRQGGRLPEAPEATMDPRGCKTAWHGRRRSRPHEPLSAHTNTTIDTTNTTTNTNTNTQHGPSARPNPPPIAAPVPGPPGGAKDCTPDLTNMKIHWKYH